MIQATTTQTALGVFFLTTLTPKKNCSMMISHRTRLLKLEGSQLPIPHAPLAVVSSCPIEPKNKFLNYPNYVAK